jgi:hypothetical protein
MENLLTAKSVPAISPPVVTGEKHASSRKLTAPYDALAGHRFLFPMFVFLVHYLIVQVTATLAYVYGTARPSSGPYESSLGAPRDMTGVWERIVGPLRLWDGLWYKQIAEKGYEYGSANAAFWPVLPWVMRYGSDLTGLQPEVIGYLFTNACFLGALIVLYQLVRIDFSQEIARRTLWAIALFPTAFFFTAVYTESPFLFFAALSLLCARKGEWLAAGVVGLLAALTRSQGIMLLAPLGLLLIQQYGFNLRRWFPNVFFAGIPILGPIFFGWRLEEAGHSYRSFIDVQGEWNRGSAMPWETFKCATRGCVLEVHQYGETKLFRADGADWSWVRQLWENPSWSLFTSRAWRDLAANSDTLELVITVLFICLAIIGLFKLPIWMSAFVWPPLIVPLLQPSSVHPLMSMPRFVIVLFPLFIVLAMLLESRWVRAISTVVSVALLILLTIQFSQWYWVS